MNFNNLRECEMLCYYTFMDFLENLRDNGWLAIILVLFLVFVPYPYLMEKTQYVNHIDNAVNIFPEDAASKNYRLEATIQTTVHYGVFFTQNNEYFVEDVTWPNGGKVVVDCVNQPFKKDDKKLCHIGDDKYYVELNQPDSYPES